MDEDYGVTELVALGRLVCSNNDHNDYFSITYGAFAKGS